jgi:N-dimethylarginine dimethylaminohydrolase
MTPEPTTTFLLCPPDHFDVEYEINPFMHLGEHPDRALAAAQWGRLRDAIEAAGAAIEVLPAEPGLPDLVFTNNAGFVHGDEAIVSRFRCEERRGEQVHDAAAFERLGLRVRELPASAGAFEGAADAMVVGERVVCGYGPRTTEDAVAHVAAFAEREPLAMRLVDPRFYHLDMALLVLDADTAVVSRAAFDPGELELLLGLFADPIVIEEDEALRFCANGAVVGRSVLMHEVPERIGSELRARGFEPVEVPVGEFTKAGGAVKCLSLDLTAPRT